MMITLVGYSVVQNFFVLLQKATAVLTSSVASVLSHCLGGHTQANTIVWKNLTRRIIPEEGGSVHRVWTYSFSPVHKRTFLLEIFS